jgi:hypothetical protein
MMRRMPERGDDLHTRVGAAYVEDITDRDAFFAAAAEGDRIQTLYLV